MRFRAGAIGLLLAGVVWASPASATPQSVDFFFSGEIIGGDNPTYTVVSSANFSWDDACVGTTTTFCELEITLTALPSPDGAMPSQGEVLAGLVFDVLGTADFRDGPPGNVPWGGSALASALEGADAAAAFAAIGLDVSAHWGLNPAISVPVNGGDATLALSSVGDIFGGLATLSTLQMFPGTVGPVETMPPDGSPFGIIDASSASGGSGWPMSDLAYVQDQLVATLLYTNTLTGVTDVLPIYGTTGDPIPEPATAALFGAGLLGLALAGRRRRSR